MYSINPTLPHWPPDPPSPRSIGLTASFGIISSSPGRALGTVCVCLSASVDPLTSGELSERSQLKPASNGTVGTTQSDAITAAAFGPVSAWSGAMGVGKVPWIMEELAFNGKPSNMSGPDLFSPVSRAVPSAVLLCYSQFSVTGYCQLWEQWDKADRDNWHT